MKKPDVKYRLWIEGEFIKFQVTKMDESIRGNYNSYMGNINIFGCLHPELSRMGGASYGVYLPGSQREMDHHIASLRIVPKGERERVYDQMQAALKACFNSSSWDVAFRYRGVV